MQQSSAAIRFILDGSLFVILCKCLQLKTVTTLSSPLFPQHSMCEFLRVRGGSRLMQRAFTHTQAHTNIHTRICTHNTHAHIHTIATKKVWGATHTPVGFSFVHVCARYPAIRAGIRMDILRLQPSTGPFPSLFCHDLALDLYLSIDVSLLEYLYNIWDALSLSLSVIPS